MLQNRTVIFTLKSISFSYNNAVAEIGNCICYISISLLISTRIILGLFSASLITASVNPTFVNSTNQVLLRLFHFILTAPVSKEMQRTLDEGAETLLYYFEQLGHQVIMVPHDSSKTNCLNYHWHVVVNSVSYIDEQIMYDRYETYNYIINYLNQCTCARWNWSYKNTDYGY